MSATNELIERLAGSAHPVRRLWSPCWRTRAWIVVLVAGASALAVSFGFRPDLAERLSDPWFTAGLAGSAVTGILAACAAFLISLPDRSRLWVLLPLPAVLLWLATVGGGCLFAWVGTDFAHIRLAQLVRCFIALGLITIPLLTAMLWMLRHAARLHPRPVIYSSALSVAAFIATALTLLHRFDGSVMILVTNFGVVALALLIDSLLGAWIVRPGAAYSKR